MFFFLLKIFQINPSYFLFHRHCHSDCFAEAAELFGLKVSLKKTEVLHQPAPWELDHLPHITTGVTELKTVHQFSYLGCTISTDAKIDKEIDNRLAKTNSTFGRLYNRVWNSKHLKKGTKFSVYRAVVTLLYIVWLRVMGHRWSPPATPWLLPSALPPQHPQHSLE